MPSIRSILACGLSALAVVSASDCDNLDIPLARSQFAGNNKGGGGFCASKIRGGILVNGLECWSDGVNVRGLKFHYSDGSQMLIGMEDGYFNGRKVHGQLNWDPLTTSFDFIHLWDNGENGGLGRIYMQLPGGSNMDCGRHANWGAPAVKVDKGAAGMIIGARGKHGANVDGIEFLVTAGAPTRVELKSLDIPATKDIKNADRVDIQELRIINRSENDTLTTGTFHWEEAWSKNVQSGTKETNTFGFDQKFTISADIPKGPSFGSETGFSEEKTSEKTEGKDESRSGKLAWEITSPMTIAPGKAKVIKMLGVKKYIPKATYKAIMEVSFKNSAKKFQYDSVAEFGLLDYSSTTYLIEDEDALEAIKKIGTKSNGNVFSSVEVDKIGHDINKKTPRAFVA